jgi:hypothetical protein
MLFIVVSPRGGATLGDPFRALLQGNYFPMYFQLKRSF